MARPRRKTPDELLQEAFWSRMDICRLFRKAPRTIDRYINHPDHRAAAVAAIKAVFPAAELNLLYPDLLEEGLTGHKVNYVYIGTREDANCYIDTTETIETKIEALRHHKSQLKNRDPGPRMRERGAMVGRQVGFEYAEAFRRITLKEWEPEE